LAAGLQDTDHLYRIEYQVWGWKPDEWVMLRTKKKAKGLIDCKQSNSWRGWRTWMARAEWLEYVWSPV
jgi:hypothetical protein